MTPEKAAHLLAHPLDYADGRIPLDGYREVHVERDGALLTCILAIDR